MKLFRTKWGIAAMVVLLLMLFLVRPGMYRLRNRISSSVGSALGRRVSIDNVQFHVLPRPGFDLEGLIIYDAPAFGAEPMIRAQEVSAAIRLRSLLFGKLEIARLNATEPSINLVRNSQGRWNLASLIERNAQIPAAPTAKSPAEHCPAFPYLEASNARINFKVGPEKKPYALTSADVALWQESENSWGARMKAQPMRTDFNLTDTGELQINATWQRAPSLRQTPVRIVVAWKKGQLGQITQLFTGRDRGWRGGLDFAANFSGTPDALVIESVASVSGFRRYDILDTRNVQLATSCSGSYSVSTAQLSGLLCESSAGGGSVSVRGKIAAITTAPSYDLLLTLKKVPLTSVLSVAREEKQQLPADLAAEGVLDAEFRASRDGSGRTQITGSGAATKVRLISNGGQDSISLGNIPLNLISASRHSKPGDQSTSEKVTAKESEPSEAHLRIGPSSLKVNNSAPMDVGGWISAEGYRLYLRGDMELSNLFRLENTLGIPSARPAAEGQAKLDVRLEGPWQQFAAPTALGTAQIKNVRAETRGLNTPIEISSANVVLSPEQISVQKLEANLGGTHWTGSVKAPRHCAPACDFQFDLVGDRLSTADLAEWFGSVQAKRPWYRILSFGEQQGPSPWTALRARGNLQVGRFDIHKFSATQVTTQLKIDKGKITLSSLRAQLLQGTHQGNWTIDASVRPLLYHGSGKLQSIALAQVAALMDDAWITGSGDGSFEMDSSGGNLQDLMTNAEGQMQFVMRNGSFAHLPSPGGSVPLSVHRFAGDLAIEKGIWKLSDGKLESRDGFYRVSGRAGATLDFMLTRGDEQSWRVAGALAKPRVTRVNREAPEQKKIAAKALVKP